MDKPLMASNVMTRNFISGFKRGAMIFLGDMASFNNFLLLTLSYFVGAGISSFFMKVFVKQASKPTAKETTTYWSEIDIGNKSVDSYYRPF